jgi:hypothetical protein
VGLKEERVHEDQFSKWKSLKTLEGEQIRKLRLLRRELEKETEAGLNQQVKLGKEAPGGSGGKKTTFKERSADETREGEKYVQETHLKAWTGSTWTKPKSKAAIGYDHRPPMDDWMHVASGTHWQAGRPWIKLRKQVETKMQHLTNKEATIQTMEFVRRMTRRNGEDETLSDIAYWNLAKYMRDFFQIGRGCEMMDKREAEQRKRKLADEEISATTRWNLTYAHHCWQYRVCSWFVDLVREKLEFRTSWGPDWSIGWGCSSCSKDNVHEEIVRQVDKTTAGGPTPMPRSSKAAWSPMLSPEEIVDWAVQSVN